MPEAKFLVGESEKHEINIRSSPWTGIIKVCVDGKKVIETRHWGFAKPIDFSIGETEKHEGLIKVSSTYSFDFYVDGKFVGNSSTSVQRPYPAPPVSNRAPVIVTSEAQSTRPKQITSLAVVWLVLGLWNLWGAFQGISGDLEVWSLVSDLSVHAWFRMAIPAELAINIAVLIAAIVQLVTVPLVLTRKLSSVKLALGVFISIAILNLIFGVLYASAPPEFRSTLTTDIALNFGFGIVQMIIVTYFWRDLNKPEVKTYFQPTQPQGES